MLGHIPRKINHILTEEERREEGRRIRKEEEVMEEEIQMKLRFEEKEKIRQDESSGFCPPI